jgi:hypothetical protein
MATAIRVNGVAEIKVGTGSAGALELLGHSFEGTTIDPQMVEEPVFTDAGGGPNGIPVTFIKLGRFDIISADIVRPGRTGENPQGYGLHPSEQGRRHDDQGWALAR